MLSDAEFAFIAREVKARSGALLSRETVGPAESRLAPLARREGFGSVSEFLHAARTRQDGKLIGALADALVQTETRFFRDKAGFERLRTLILPELQARRGGERVRIWSAGCSTGQEPYALAMMVEAMRAEGFPGAEIVASDLSERLLDKARSGLYTQFEVQRGLPIRKLIEHFEKVADLWRISDRMRASVKFESHNLLQHAGAIASAPFDVIVCANVMTSFDPATRAATLERLADALTPGGVLMLGAGEAAPEGLECYALEAGVIRRTKSSRRAA